MISSPLSATHNRAGEITYEQIGDQTIRARITTYTKTSSRSADRDTVQIFWGDGSSEFLFRANGSGDPLQNDVKVNYYIGEHTYPGRGTYTISMTDPNRVASILNVNFPNSVNVPFYIETTFTLLNPLFQGRNNSITLLQAPIDFACVGQVFVHNPNAFDIDGDSIAYEYTIPRLSRDSDVPDYIFPDQIDPGDDNQISLDPVTGTFTWMTPQRSGEYNIAFKIKEYRQGILINSTTRDMQIFVRNCTNSPPKIEVIENLCVIAGEIINIPVNVTDLDQGQLVSLGATGGPLIFEDSPAVLLNADGFKVQPYTATLQWQTTCNHISPEEYQIVFRAVDNAFGDTTGLADLKTLRITVIGPPPQNVEAVSSDNAVNVTWELPYECELVEDDFFLGFSVWRKIETSNLEIDSCSFGLDNSQYEEIIFITNEIENGKYSIIDPNVDPRQIYCYRVLGEFAKRTDSGNPFNKVSSIPSNEFCVLIKQDFPLLTKTSVITTDQNTGSIAIEWTKPIPEDLDTIMNPGPYRYQLLRRQYNSGEEFSEITEANFRAQNFSDQIDTFYIDSNLNTLDNQYEYRIEFYTSDSMDDPLSPEDASSVFLSVTPTDQTNVLNWSVDVPWQNQRYIIYKEINNSFDSIGMSTNETYSDKGLVNGEEVCYFIEAIGTYGLQTTPPIIINDSQVNCAIPVDDVTTCKVDIQISNICNDPSRFALNQSDINKISWRLINNTCDPNEVISEYNIYYSTTDTTGFELVGTSIDPFYDHSPRFGIEGCYAVTTVDQLGNEGAFSSQICLENCPTYKLPNAFTPNNDGDNDLFIPIEAQFISRVNMEVFNQWGQKVFETQDPSLNWNGTNMGGQDLADGVYYYSCRIFEQKIESQEIEADIINGTIHLIKGK